MTNVQVLTGLTVSVYVLQRYISMSHRGLDVSDADLRTSAVAAAHYAALALARTRGVA